MPPDRRRLIAAFAMGLIPFLAACQGPARIDQSGWGPVDGSRGDASEAITALEAYPELRDPRIPERAFRLLGDGPTGEGAFGASEDGGELRLVLTVSGMDSPLTERVVVEREDGAWVIPRMFERDREVINEFDPPLLLFPDELEAGGEISQEVEIIVRPIDDPERVKEDGTATLTMSDRGIVRYALTPGSAPIEARVIRSDLEMDFGPAQVRNRIDRWFALGGGLIAERSEVRVKVLGVETERTRRQLVAREAPED